MTLVQLSETEKIEWLRLARTRGVGPVGFAELLRRYKTATAALNALPNIAKRAVTIPPRAHAEDEISNTAAFGARIVASCEPEFPPLLRALDPPPPLLSILGDAALAGRPCVAIVGARNASAAGRKMARDIAAALSSHGRVVVSGMARGIDGEAHRASLDGGTIAVLGGGIDHIYPPDHESLYAAIASKGLLVSESPLGHKATSKDFPRRNRIITGLAEGVVVVEAAERSGSLISARTAAEQGREVMAVPGSPLDPRAAGALNLLKDGAALVRSADDVLDVLNSLSRGRLEARPPPDFEDQSSFEEIPQNQLDAVRLALSPFPMSIDEISRAAGIGARRCAAALLELELAGEAITLPGGLAQRAV